MLKIIAKEQGKHSLDVDLEKAAKVTGLPVEANSEAARGFNASAAGTIIFVPGKDKQRNDLIACFSKLMASYSPGKKYIIFYNFGNTLGVNTVLDRLIEGRTAYPELLKKIEHGQLKAMLMLGENLAASHPDLEKKIRHLKFVAMSGCFAAELMDDSVLLLPLASHLEGRGTYAMADGKLEKPEAVAPPVGARSNLEIIAAIMNAKIELEAILRETGAEVEQGAPSEAMGLNEKIAEAQKIKAGESATEANITHFGNNNLVRNFMWYKVNNVG
jgi:anaerobic selenocysteine-containing dehydrogenase